MSRYDPKSHDEVASRHSDEAQRRTPRKVEGRPLSPSAIERLYAKSAEMRPDMKAKDESRPQRVGDDNNLQGKGYRNDTSGWVRGEGSVDGGLYPCFDRGKYDISDKPDRKASGGRPNTASGQDCHKSPFSAAHRSFEGGGDDVSNRPSRADLRDPYRKI